MPHIAKVTGRMRGGRRQKGVVDVHAPGGQRCSATSELVARSGGRARPNGPWGQRSLADGLPRPPLSDFDPLPPATKCLCAARMRGQEGQEKERHPGGTKAPRDDLRSVSKAAARLQMPRPPHHAHTTR